MELKRINESLRSGVPSQGMLFKHKCTQRVEPRFHTSHPQAQIHGRRSRSSIQQIPMEVGSLDAMETTTANSLESNKHDRSADDASVQDAFRAECKKLRNQSMNAEAQADCASNNNNHPASLVHQIELQKEMLQVQEKIRRERMGSLMASWDSPVSHSRQGDLGRSSSFTKHKIENFWKTRRHLEQEHLRVAANCAAVAFKPLEEVNSQSSNSDQALSVEEEVEKLNDYTD